MNCKPSVQELIVFMFSCFSLLSVFGSFMRLSAFPFFHFDYGLSGWETGLIVTGIIFFHVLYGGNNLTRAYFDFNKGVVQRDNRKGSENWVYLSECFIRYRAICFLGCACIVFYLFFRTDFFLLLVGLGIFYTFSFFESKLKVSNKFLMFASCCFIFLDRMRAFLCEWRVSLIIGPTLQKGD